ncbi:hypothetical protein C8R47DRAFT_1141815 [Mycena vitilis]|nr:hypothetical protein C8R47DRAFT_1141815 [Mycena vitilis]
MKEGGDRDVIRCVGNNLCYAFRARYRYGARSLSMRRARTATPCCTGGAHRCYCCGSMPGTALCLWTRLARLTPRLPRKAPGQQTPDIFAWCCRPSSTTTPLLDDDAPPRRRTVSFVLLALRAPAPSPILGGQGLAACLSQPKHHLPLAQAVSAGVCLLQRCSNGSFIQPSAQRPHTPVHPKEPERWRPPRRSGPVQHARTALCRASRTLQPPPCGCDAHRPRPAQRYEATVVE